MQARLSLLNNLLKVGKSRADLKDRGRSNYIFFTDHIGSPQPDPYFMSAVMPMMCSRWKYFPSSRFGNRY